MRGWDVVIDTRDRARWLQSPHACAALARSVSALDEGDAPFARFASLGSSTGVDVYLFASEAAAQGELSGAAEHIRIATDGTASVV